MARKVAFAFGGVVFSAVEFWFVCGLGVEGAYVD